MARVVKEHLVEARIYHWIHLISIIVLAITGWFIHWPFFTAAMSTMRFIHFIFMYVVVFNLILRLSYAFLSRNRDWREFGLGWKQIKAIPGTALYYLFIRKEVPDVVVKYNPMQKLTYILFAILIIPQALTGFALYTSTASYFNWVTNLLGGLARVRAWHFFIMWIFIILVAVHIYLSLFEDFAQFKYMVLSVTPEELKK